MKYLLRTRISVLKLMERLVEALVDPASRERTMLCALSGYVAMWTLYGILAKISQDVQFDAAEVVGWSREPLLGYSKHPPLAAWLVHAWFSIFPVRDWSYYLFTMVYAAVGLWVAWRLFGLVLDSGKRVLALASLTLVPYFNFHGLRFDHNAVLGPLWAATALCFIRSFETRSLIWAALAGAAAAAAMLGKYWSVFLLVGLALGALFDQRRRDYFLSAAPWITSAVGALLLAPHLVWLEAHNFISLTYATAKHFAQTFGQSLAGAVEFVAGGASYGVGPIVLVLAATWPGRKGLADMVLPREPDRRFLAVAFWTPLLLPPVVSLTLGLELKSIWAMPGLVLLPMMMLSSRLLSVPPRALMGAVAVAVAFPLVMSAASPAIAVAIHLAGVAPAGAHAKLLAARIEYEWRQSTDRPLHIVGGDHDLAYSAAFYMPEPPSAFPVLHPQDTPWVTPERIAREGGVFVCFMFFDRRFGQVCRDQPTSSEVDRLTAGNAATRKIEITLTRTFIGIPGTPARYLIVIAPPR